MFLFILLLCLSTLTSQCNQDLLSNNEIEYLQSRSSEVLNNMDNNFKEQNLLLNFLYHNYYFAQLDHVYKKNIALAISQLTDAQNSLNFSESFNSPFFKKLISIITVLERKRTLYGKTCQLLNTKIEQECPNLLKTIEHIQEVSMHFQQEYRQKCPSIDINNLQFVSSLFLKQCYDTLHDNMTSHFTDQSIQLLIADNEQLVNMDEIINNSNSSDA